MFQPKACDDLSVDQPQAGADVTWGYKGLMQVEHVPNDKPYYQSKMCPVNVHWHVGAEHRSAGQYDENGTGPTTKSPSPERPGFRCNHYDAADPKFTTPYEFKHCDNMEVCTGLIPPWAPAELSTSTRPPFEMEPSAILPILKHLSKV